MENQENLKNDKVQNNRSTDQLKNFENNPKKESEHDPEKILNY